MNFKQRGETMKWWFDNPWNEFSCGFSKAKTG